MKRHSCHNKMGMAMNNPPYPATLRRRLKGSRMLTTRKSQFASGFWPTSAVQYGWLSSSMNHGYMNHAGIISTNTDPTAINRR